MNNNIEYYKEDDISLLELLETIWKDRLIIIGLTSFFLIVAIFYSISLPNIYQSRALLNPTEELSDSSISRGFSNLTGSPLGSESSKVAEAIGKIKSYSFFTENILPNINLQDLAALESWDPKTKKIFYNKNIYNEEDNVWLKLPTNQKSFRYFKDILTVKQSNDTPFITVSVKHQSPIIASEWAKLIVQEINNYFRSKDKKEAQASLSFLNDKLRQTNYAEIKEVIAELIQQKTQKLTLIEVNEYYILEYIDAPIIPEIKLEPFRTMICLFGAFLGMLLGVVFSLMRGLILSETNT